MTSLDYFQRNRNLSTSVQVSNFNDKIQFTFLSIVVSAYSEQFTSLLDFLHSLVYIHINNTCIDRSLTHFIHLTRIFFFEIFLKYLIVLMMPPCKSRRNGRQLLCKTQYIFAFSSSFAYF